MPQASDELREYITSEFGDIDCSPPQQFLESCGHELTHDWQWKLKEGTTLETISEKEFRCIKFLIDEWDYGSVLK